MKNKKNNHGFTLVELLLYIGIASVLLVVISLFLSTILEARLKQQSMMEIESQGTQIMEQITQAIRNAEGINSPNPGGSSSTLSLAMSNGNNPTLFALSSETLNITEGATSPIPLSNDRITVSDFNVTNTSRADTPGILKIEFSLTHKNPSGRNEYTYSKTFETSSSLRHP